MKAFCVDSKTKIRYFNRIGDEVVFEIPQIILPDFRCAEYARKSRELLFPELKKINSCCAWDLKYFNEYQNSEERIENAKPGDLVTFFNPESDFNTTRCGETDFRGNERTATHVGLVIDFNFFNQALILHQYKKPLIVNDIDTLRKKGLDARELIL